MSVSLGRTPTAIVYEVEELVRMVRDGEIRIPEFQRPFRWGIEDARRLFDSILNGYPVGSLLLWNKRAESARITVGALTVDAPATDKALWVVDGQQRLTTLANALTQGSARDDRFALSLDLRDNSIVSTKTNERRRATIPLYILFDLQKLIEWFRDHPDDQDYFGAATAAATKIRLFKIPASVVETEDEQILRDIFDRLNSYGKRLTRTEVFSALHPAQPSSKGIHSAAAIEDISRALAVDHQFGSVDDDTILKAVLARRGPDISREIRVEFDSDRRNPGDFAGEDVETAYREAALCLERAVEFLKSECHIPHFAFLPYRHLLVVLSRFFAHYELDTPRELQLLRRWLWRAAAAGANLFAGSTTGTTRALNQLIVPSDLDGTLERLLAAVPRSKVALPDAGNFRTNTAAGKIVACAMWSMHPRSIRTTEQLTAADLLDSLGDAQTPRPALSPVVSRAGLVGMGGKSDTAGRWLLLPGVEMAPSEISSAVLSQPIGTGDENWAATLRSHALTPSSLQALAAGDRLAFAQQREIDLNATVKRFLQQRWEFEYEDTPPLDWLVVDDLEVDSDSDE